MVFFPEGTFPQVPGLLKFHLGAFVTAVRVGCPLVPATVRGTRRALPPKGLPWPGAIEFELLPALAPGEGERCARGAAAAGCGAQRDPRRARGAGPYMFRRY